MGHSRLSRPRQRARGALAACLFALACAGLAPPARAQVNAETLRSTLKKYPNFLWLDAALVGRAGNTNTTTFSGSAFGGVTREPHVFFAKAAGDYGQADHSTNVAKWLFHARYDYLVTDAFALEALAQAQHNRFQRLAVRDLYGAGVRFVPYADDEVELAVGTTYLLEHEVVSAVTGSAGTNEVQHRSSTYLAFAALVLPLVTANAVIYAQPRFDRPIDFRVLHESSLTVTITKLLAAKVSGSLWYDNEPPFGVKSYDVEVKNSLVLKLF
jgi:hypothetical protein